MILLRWIGGLLVLIVGILTVSYLQGRFDEGDLKKAILVVQEKIPDAKNCEGEVVSRFRGRVRVKCWRNNQAEEWVVDLIHAKIGGKTDGK